MKRHFKWQILKIIMVNWTIFVMLIMGYTIYEAHRAYQALQVITGACRADWERLGQKIENGEVVVKSEQTLIIDKDGMEKK